MALLPWCLVYLCLTLSWMQTDRLCRSDASSGKEMKAGQNKGVWRQIVFFPSPCSLACGSMSSWWNQQWWRGGGSRFRRKGTPQTGLQQPTVWLGNLCSEPQNVQERLCLQQLLCCSKGTSIDSELLLWTPDEPLPEPLPSWHLHCEPCWELGSRHGERTGLCFTKIKSYNLKKMRIQRTDV